MPKTKEIRFGTCDWPKQVANEVLCHAILIGRVDLSTKAVQYLGIPTWTFNGLQIGRADKRYVFNFTEEWTPDPDFAAAGLDNKEMLDAWLPAIAAAPDGQFVQIEVDPPGEDEEQKVFNVMPLPLSTTEPECSGYERPDVLNEIKDKASDIVVVVSFEDYNSRDIPLNLPINVQLDLEPTESYESFRESVLNTETEPEGETVEQRLNRLLNDDWKLWIWFLPQCPGSKKMYEWRDRNTPGDFLDEDLLTGEEGYEREVYVVVYVVDEKGYREALARKDDVEAEEEEEANDEGDDGETGDGGGDEGSDYNESVVQSRRKSTTGKQAAK